MSRNISHLNTAKNIIEQYKGEMPLHLYLKSFFSLEKKYGSRDRRTISALCYYYFRLGSGEKILSVEERILLGAFLCGDKSSPFLAELKPEWDEKVHLPLQQKLKEIEHFYPTSIFPLQNELSTDIEGATFSLSFLIQPKLFIRIRPGREDGVLSKLSAAKISFEPITENCFAFENGTKLEEVLQLNKDYVIQDYNSQRVGEFLAPILSKTSSLSSTTLSGTQRTTVWDCCAASGGKSIMAFDLNPTIDLTVSDIRPSILQNLNKRFGEAGIQSYRPFIADLYNTKGLRAALGDQQFDVIICDAPCSGSGTWSRTPEQLHYFDGEEIERYSNLQKRIVSNVLPFLKPGGHLLYITCSVFEKENEDVVGFIKEKLPVELVKMELLKGYSVKADTLFAALFTKAST